MDTKIDQVNGSQELSSEPLLSPRPAQDSELSGRELDKAVAERVMGFDGVEWWSAGDLRYRNRALELERGGRWASDVRHYSKYIEAAMEVVERMQTNHFAFSCQRWGAGTEWGVMFRLVDEARHDSADAMSESLPEAICRAALAAVENNSDTKTVAAHIASGKG